LIVDDHAVVRQGLRTFIDLQDDMQVVGEGENGLQAVELAGRLQPDVILLDLVMPQMDGVEATRKILERSPHSRVLILTSFGEDDKVFPAIRGGAQGYLLKDIHPSDLVQAVREAHQGKVQLHPDIARKLMSAVAAAPPAGAPQPAGAPPLAGASSPGSTPGAPPPKAAPSDLTERELEVLRLIARGMNNAEIAAQMVISEKTVKTHVSNVLGKLGVADRTQAAIWALKHGIVG
jgi:DNA-binding NarL/FixJ family response regulator